MLRHIALILLVACAGKVVVAQPGGHETEAVPPTRDASVQDPATAWLRLNEHRDRLAESAKAEDWDTVARLGDELGPVAEDLVRASGDLPSEVLGPTLSAVRDLGVTGRQLGNAARAQKASRVSDLLLRVDLHLKKIGEKYPAAVLTP
jgi:hypothetical protein